MASFPVHTVYHSDAAFAISAVKELPLLQLYAVTAQEAAYGVLHVGYIDSGKSAKCRQSGRKWL